MQFNCVLVGLEAGCAGEVARVGTKQALPAAGTRPSSGKEIRAGRQLKGFDDVSADIQ